jgi:Dyp-type peroxidase family
MTVDRTTEQQLALDQIQGDILVGLQKEAEVFVGFAIADVVRFKRFLRGLHLTTARDALQAQDKIDAFRKNGGTGLLDIRGVNIAFSYDGLHKLGVKGINQIKDAAFKQGLAKRSVSLGDPPTGEASAPDWLVGNGVGELDGLLILTGRDNATVTAMLHDLDMAAGSGTWIPFYVDNGNTRPGKQHGHEHFGFLDGVSQPAVRGQISHFFPTKQFLDPSQNPADPNQGLPGADLHWPGEFVFGYPKQDPTDIEAVGQVADGGLPWMQNGSFMVFRRLEQLVPEFHATVKTKAVALGETADVLGARMVGRFPSGSPVSLTPSVDDSTLGGNPLKNNDFEFGDDPDGRKCPYSAHIRKSYPRNDITPAATGSTDEQQRDSSEADTQTHRVMRRGIPFGMEVQADESLHATTKHSRGLMFVCYQTSIENQFEFIIKNWVNNKDFAKPATGEDPVIGQAIGANRTRHFAGGKLNFPTGPIGPVTTLEADFVRPTGGGYFFMPSLYAVQSVLAV